ncbi:YybH family protein [Marinoscillum sp.]|uniref:YybH family protein n=1 Tax=Marinoscillum sp. TaxID=2024838 RepID=UPI003BAC470D
METSRPEDIANQFAAYWNQKDASGISNLFVEDAEFVNVVGLWWHNRQDIYKAHEYGLRVIFPESTLKVTRTTTRMLSDHIALVHARMHLMGQTSQEGRHAEDRRTLFSFVIMKQPDGGWKAVSAHNTDIVPGAETHLTQDGHMKPTSYR